MHETAQAFFHLDYPANPTLCASGMLTLRGWAVGKEGPLTDLKVRLAGKTYPGVHGFLRPDLASHFKSHTPHFPAGFEVNVSLPPGSHEAIFEACDISGSWREIATVVLIGAPDSSYAPPTIDNTVVQPHEFAYALQTVLRRAANEPLDLAARTVVAAMPASPVTRYPHQPFHGHLHLPALLERTHFGRMNIKGWLFHETMEIRQVTATVDLQAWQALERGAAVPYVQALFPQQAHARNCKIEGQIDVPSQLPSPLSVRIYAELADGSWHLCHVQRTTTIDSEQEKSPYLRYGSLAFAQACFALKRAYSNSGMNLPIDRLLWRAIRGVHREFKLTAPRRKTLAALPDFQLGSNSAPTPRSVALITHNLSYEGAPLFLLEYARALHVKGVSLQVISAVNGPLRAEYERLGARVQIIDTSPLHETTSAPELKIKLGELSRVVEMNSADLVVANTLSVFWGIHIAHLQGRPSLFYIHESTTPASFYRGYLPYALLSVVEETFTLATHVSFLTEATRRYYRPWLARSNHSLNPGWIDLPQTDCYLAAHSRSELRQRLALDESTRLVVNLGSICDRKGQNIFARAVDLLWRRYPALAATARFLMVGGRNTLYDQTVADLLKTLNRPNLQVVVETSTPLDYYGAADLFVCSSYEESFPRVILEAMACQLPILSTNVHGIPEQVRADHEALLVPPGDSHALCEGLATLLQQKALADRYAANARVRVAAEFDLARVLPRHLALACELAARKG